MGGLTPEVATEEKAGNFSPLHRLPGGAAAETGVVVEKHIPPGVGEGVVAGEILVLASRPKRFARVGSTSMLEVTFSTVWGGRSLL